MRPLAIVNMDNRLLTSSARIRWEPIFNEWVSLQQRGFLYDRSMLHNIVDIDMQAPVVAATSDEVVMFLIRDLLQENLSELSSIISLFYTIMVVNWFSLF